MHHVRGGDRRLHRVADRVEEVVLLQHRQREARVVGWTKTSASVSSAAAQKSRKRSAPRYSPSDEAATSTPESRPSRHQLGEQLRPVERAGPEHATALRDERRRAPRSAAPARGRAAAPTGRARPVDPGGVLLLDDPSAGRTNSRTAERTGRPSSSTTWPCSSQRTSAPSPGRSRAHGRRRPRRRLLPTIDVAGPRRWSGARDDC